MCNILWKPMECFERGIEIGKDATIKVVLEFLRFHFPESFSGEDGDMTESFIDYINNNIEDFTDESTR